MSFDEHSMEVLEYPKVLEILHGLCLTRYGMEMVERMAPLTDSDAITTRLTEVTQMRDIIQFRPALPLYRLDDITGIINRSKTVGIFIEPAELLQVKELIDVCNALHRYAPDDRHKFPLIAEYLKELHPLTEVSEAIGRTIDNDGEIKDSASTRLKAIRSEIANIKRKIVARLDRILSERQKTPGWQDDMITMRDGRYVIPVLAGQFRPDSGIIHDRSQSGATMYVEPNETVELNNSLGTELQNERLEIDRILRALTAQVGREHQKLLANTRLIGILDLIHASAGLSIKIDGAQPLIDGVSRLNLLDCRHPLLMYYTQDKSAVVGNDLTLDGARLGLIITGPNTGGKTVALKTVGLLVLMAQSGLHIPAADKSEIGIFHNVLADIGGEQSIGLSLATFSSHVRQIAYAVEHAHADSLVLLDEIGAGTDPKEGAALAEAILLKLVENKARIIVTTHYSQLKTLPMEHPELENASFEFDRKSLRPTFRLQIGIPGASYAVEIAERLGMNKDITRNASRLLGKAERSLTGLIESLESELAALRKDKAALQDKLKHTAQLEDFYKSQTEKLASEMEQTKKEHLQELEKVLTESRLEIERLVKRIRETNASKDSVKQAHKFLQSTTNLQEHLKKKYSPPVNHATLNPGDTVRVASFKKEGELVELKDRQAKVRIGNMMFTVDADEISRVAGPSQDTSHSRNSGPAVDFERAGPEISLLGMTAEEAAEALDKFLDSAILTGMSQVYVVHGKGTGALRKKMTEFLKAHPAVADIRLGNWNEGGAGVTIVRLKD